MLFKSKAAAVELPQPDYSRDFIHWAAIVIGKKQRNIPLNGWKEELMDDLLQDWIKTLGEIGS